MIQGKRVILKPMESIDYFIDLAEYNNKETSGRAVLSNQITEFGGEFFDVWIDGCKHGVIGYFNFNGMYVLEAIKDSRHSTKGISYSIEVGELMVDRLFKITDTIYTIARRNDKAIQIFCKKLKFIETDNILNDSLDLILYRRDRCQ